MVFVLAAAILAAGAAGADDACETPVDTAFGKIAGTSEEGTDTCVWRGVPYAAAPVDDLRWRAPRPTPRWDGKLDATRFGDRCMQAGGLLGGGGAPGVGMSEDCLNLNIWRPTRPGKYPVMFWIHGGGYYVGSGSDPQYWGDRLAEAGEVMVVTINYRMSLFGFMAHPDLRDEDPNRSTGGYGMLDQAFALKWVHENIAGFGGDPDNITIFGQSAGGCSVCTLLASPLAKGRFRRIIMQSAACELTRDLEAGYEQTRGIMETFGCDDLDCMRELSAEEINDKAAGSLFEGFQSVPCHDGYALTDTPLAMIRAGDYNRAQVMAGSVLDEFGKALKLKPAYKYTTPGGYEKRLMKSFGMTEDEAARLVELYPLDEYNGRPVEAMGRMLGADAVMQCPGHRLVVAADEDGLDTWFFRFDYHGMKYGKYLGSYHTAELPFLFNSFDRPPSTMFYDEERTLGAMELSRTMQAYWTNFAKTGDPNGPGLPEWTPFSAEDQWVQVLDAGRVEPENGDDTAQRCEFWDGHGGEFLEFANELVSKLF